MAPDCPLPSCDGRIGQLGRCQECGYEEETPHASFTGGAGARTHPTSDREYREQMRKIEEKAGE